MAEEKIFEERIFDRLLPRRYTRLSDFADYCKSIDAEEVKVGVESRIEGSGYEADQKFRPVYHASAEDEDVIYQGRESYQSWVTEFSGPPENLNEKCQDAAYDSWTRFLEDREFLERQGFSTTSFIP